MKRMILGLFSLLVIFLMSSPATAEWEEPIVTMVSQDGGQFGLIGKYGKNVYVLNADTTAGNTLKFYKSTDGGHSFDSGRILGYNVPYGEDTDMKVALNGDIHIFWKDGSNDIIYHIKSKDNGNSFSDFIALTSGMDWADQPYCFIKDQNEIYLVFRAFSDPKPEVYFVKSSNGGISFAPPIRVTNNSIQEDNPKINAYMSYIFMAYNE